MSLPVKRLPSPKTRRTPPQGSPERSQLERKSDQVTRLFLDELRSPEEIAQTLSLPIQEVRETCSRLNLKAAQAEMIQEAKERVFEDKVPTLSQIVSSSLTRVLAVIDNLDPADLGIDDAVKLTNISKNLNEMLRLEKGESTSNVAITSVAKTQERVTQIFEVMRADPVFADETALEPDPLDDEPKEAQPILKALPEPAPEAEVLERVQEPAIKVQTPEADPNEPF